ncbi:3-oxoacyl-[acyl-carrier-protein] synthase 3 [Seminavis robusta]|uniref:beta-ketoacyl-[acyl-carrier-protein] synthase III n=1 Tax=Seminavis robusta TaxID=568900 RepID=A0A9N8DWT9_9STRA|nr:3-oxoacyl-[acyl-carrier-protein] synthase 3 [Seminavis robusta]|eukprot:Sro435_g142450.1 3-oxoacyl-[acyl-carrier-protein] synthase 3 (375) ;mRNA; f:61840-63075
MKTFCHWSLCSLAFLVGSVSAFAPQNSKAPVSTTTQLGASAGALGCRPIGIGSAAPKHVVTNVDLEKVVETSDEWIRTRTGISKRHLLLDGEDLRSLGAEAAKNAIDMAGIKVEDIDLVIVATSSADDMFGDAPSIAQEIGCGTNTVAFDLTAACSGFLFSTVTAGKFLSGGGFKNAVVIGADALSRWVDWDDRNTCILFGDGAGAMVLTTDEDSPGILGYAAHSNGGGYQDLKLGYEGSPRHVATPGEGTTVSSGSFGKIGMNGKEVYKFATREVPAVLQEALDSAGMTIDDVDHLLLHQANIRIMETVAKRLGISMDKVIANLDEYGNTSAASIPLAFDEAVRSGRVKNGDVVACAGFGAGLSWGAAIFKWN